MPKVTAHQLTLAQSALGDIYANLEQTLFKMVVDRLIKKGVFDFDRDHVLQWQLEKLNELNLINTETIEEVAKATKIAEPKLRTLFEDAGYAVAHAEYQRLAKATGKTMPMPITDQVLAGYLKQTFLDLNNNVNQTLLTTNYQDNAVVQTYQQIVKETTAQVITGLKTPKQALASTIYKWRDKGIKTVLTDKSKHAWSLEAYARMVINTTSNRAFQAVRNQAAEDYGIDTFLMSSHEAARPTCAPIQGKTVTTRSKGFTAPESGEWFEPLDNHGYGKPAGTFGINCGHMMWPYIPGVNTNNQEQYDPEEAVEKGDITQNQRLLERKVRKAKRNEELAKQLDDEPGKIKYRTQKRRYQAALRKLIKDNDFLSRDYSREKIYGADAKNDLERKSYNYDLIKDQKRYASFRQVMGSKRPEVTLEKYRLAKYNRDEEWRKIESNYLTSKRMNSGVWGTTINPEKQAPHVKLTHTKGKSYFGDQVDCQKLLDIYSATGQLRRTKNGFSHIELVKNVYVDGIVLTKSGKKLRITGITIHHSKGRTHIVPYAEKE